MPGKVADKNPRCRLDNALKGRTVLSSELSSDLRGRNLALICGAKKQIKTWYLKQQLAVRDIEASRVRLAVRMQNKLGARRFSSETDLVGIDLNPNNSQPESSSQIPELSRSRSPKVRKNSDLLLLERQLARQRALFGFDESSFRKINVYKVDKLSGDVVRIFDSMPVECLFPALTISGGSDRAAAEPPPAVSDANANNININNNGAAEMPEKQTTSQTNNNNNNNWMWITESSNPADSLSFEHPSSNNGSQRGATRGEDKFDILATQPGLTRKLSVLNDKMKTFIGHLDDLGLSTEEQGASIFLI